MQLNLLKITVLIGLCEMILFYPLQEKSRQYRVQNTEPHGIASLMGQQWLAIGSFTRSNLIILSIGTGLWT